MTLENTDKSLSQVIDAINLQFPDLAGRGFESYVHYTYYSGVSCIIFSGMLLVLSLLSFFISFICDGENKVFMFFVGTIMLFFCFLGFAHNLPIVLSPEGAVVREIIKGLK